MFASVLLLGVTEGRKGHFVPAQKPWRGFFRAWMINSAAEIPLPTQHQTTKVLDLHHATYIGSTWNGKIGL